MTNLKPAIEYFGSQTKLAHMLGINPMAITQWKKRGIPPRRAQQIARITNGAVKVTDLLPDFLAE